MNPRILLVDDERDILDTYAELLAAHGFETTSARTREEAIGLLDAQPWDVVILDERLHGPGSASNAPDLLAEIAARSPHARAIVVTGFASRESIQAAVAAGAWDYMEKRTNFIQQLLPLRVRQAVEAARQRRLAGRDPAAIEAELRRTWTSALAATDPHQKGRLLEETLSLVFRTIPGLEDVVANRRSRMEEFDLVVANGSTDPVLSREGSFFLVECKNWSGRVDPKELHHLVGKLQARRGRVKLGLLVAPGGFTAGVDTAIQRQANGDLLVLPVDGAALTSWIDGPDRGAWLRDRVRSGALRE